MTSVQNSSDLLALREVFAQLGRAIAVSDLSGVEASTEALRRFLATEGPAKRSSVDRDLVEQLDLASADVAALLASRLRAYDSAISAWREAEEVK